MIGAVRNFLVRHQLTGDTTRLAWNVEIGRNFLFHVFNQNGAFVTVKVLRTGGIEREYQSLQDAFQLLPEYVPAPLAFGKSQGLGMLACEGVRHARLSNVMLAQARDRLVRGMRDYSVRSVHYFTMRNASASHLRTFEEILAGLGDRALSDVMTGYLRELNLGRIEALPHVRQHGDLVANNVGITDTGIVIFDWEDFGRVHLPGFDVGVFLTSCLKYDSTLVKRWFEGATPEVLEAVVQDVCKVLEIDRSLFWSMLPMYLCHFLLLKNVFDYGGVIKSRVRNLIMSLCDQQ